MRSAKVRVLSNLIDEQVILETAVLHMVIAYGCSSDGMGAAGTIYGCMWGTICRGFSLGWGLRGEFVY